MARGLVGRGAADAEELPEALPGDPELVRTWALANVPPAGDVAGIPVWRWGDVLDVVRRAQSSTPRWLTTEEAAERLGVSRSSLDAIRSNASPTLPGAPVQVGEGRGRRHLRWDADQLDAWFAAARATPPVAKAKVRTPRRSASRSTAADAPVDWSEVIRRAG